MNRRNFIRGALALPFAGIGATERFLVGRYGAPVAVGLVRWPMPPITLGAYAAAILILGKMHARVAAAAAIRFQMKALQCGKHS